MGRYLGEPGFFFHLAGFLVDNQLWMQRYEENENIRINCLSQHAEHIFAYFCI
jgi:hypothetical protein